QAVFVARGPVRLHGRRYGGQQGPPSCQKTGSLRWPCSALHSVPASACVTSPAFPQSRVLLNLPENITRQETREHRIDEDVKGRRVADRARREAGKPAAAELDEYEQVIGSPRPVAHRK